MNKSEIVSNSFKRSQDAQKVLMQKVKRDYEKDEDVKAITGKSSFTPELLNSIIEDKERECQRLQEVYRSVEQDIKTAEARLAMMSKQYDDLLEWSAAYENATMPAKKMSVPHLIERVDVFRGYKLKIKLNINVEQFLNGLNEIEDVSLAIPA